MTKETMTLRSALSRRKMLDKKIDDLVRHSNFIGIYHAADGDLIRGTGMTKAAFTSDITEAFQSLNDMIKRREALNCAILDANTANKITVPKFVSFETLGEGDQEDISFATAISRKAYYTRTLGEIAKILFKVANNSIGVADSERERNRIEILQQVRSEFAQVQNPSSKQIHDRQADLEAKATIELVDPIGLRDVATKSIDKIKEYLEMIDIKLGHATEVTEITIEY